MAKIHEHSQTLAEQPEVHAPARVHSRSFDVTINSYGNNSTLDEKFIDPTPVTEIADTESKTFGLDLTASQIGQKVKRQWCETASTIPSEDEARSRMHRSIVLAYKDRTEEEKERELNKGGFALFSIFNDKDGFAKLVYGKIGDKLGFIIVDKKGIRRPDDSPKRAQYEEVGSIPLEPDTKVLLLSKERIDNFFKLDSETQKIISQSLQENTDTEGSTALLKLLPENNDRMPVISLQKQKVVSPIIPQINNTANKAEEKPEPTSHLSNFLGETALKSTLVIEKAKGFYQAVIKKIHIKNTKNNADKKVQPITASGENTVKETNLINKRAKVAQHIARIARIDMRPATLTYRTNEFIVAHVNKIYNFYSDKEKGRDRRKLAVLLGALAVGGVLIAEKYGFSFSHLLNHNSVGTHTHMPIHPTNSLSHADQINMNNGNVVPKNTLHNNLGSSRPMNFNPTTGGPSGNIVHTTNNMPEPNQAMNGNFIGVPPSQPLQHIIHTHLTKGSNIWDLSKQYLQKSGNPAPTNAQIQILTDKVLKANHITEQGARFLPVGDNIIIP